MSWTKKYHECKNCGTQRFQHKVHGYCVRCAHSRKRLKEVDLWDLGQPHTLIGYPRDILFHDSQTFGKIKDGHLKQYKERLDSIKRNEKKLQQPISGLDLEYKIREVAGLCGVDGAKLFFGEVDSFNFYFDENQKKVLYEKLNRITENIKWQGINWNELFFTK